MASTNPNRTQRERITYNQDLKSHENTIYTIARMEYKRINGSHLIDFNELLAIGNVVVNNLLEEGKSKYNTSYMSNAIKWAIRNELRRRYKWYSSREDKPENKNEIAYTAILSINELTEQDNPVQIADKSITPDKQCEFKDLRIIVKASIKKLPTRERSIIESRFYNDKKIKDLAEEFEISPSRISRIIQSGLDKIKKDLEKQELGMT